MKKSLKWLLLIPVILIVGVVGYFFFAIYMLGGSSHVDVKESFKEYYDKRNELIQLVDTYQLEYDENGLLINLDKVNLDGLAFNDGVYVRYQEEELLVEFIINSGFPDEGQSLVYSSSGEDLLKEIIYDYAYVEKLEEKWYKVQYN